MPRILAFAPHRKKKVKLTFPALHVHYGRERERRGKDAGGTDGPEDAGREGEGRGVRKYP